MLINGIFGFTVCVLKYPKIKKKSYLGIGIQKNNNKNLKFLIRKEAN